MGLIDFLRVTLSRRWCDFGFRKVIDRNGLFRAVSLFRWSRSIVISFSIMFRRLLNIRRRGPSELSISLRLVMSALSTVLLKRMTMMKDWQEDDYANDECYPAREA